MISKRLINGHHIFSIPYTCAKVINDPRVEIRILGEGVKPPPESSIESSSFRAISRSIRQVFPEVVVAPYTLTAGTDAKHYRGLSENTYLPGTILGEQQDIKRLHGTNERISVRNFQQCVLFYVQLLRNSDT